MSDPSAQSAAQGRGARRAIWSLADQILSAATNVAMSIVVARNVDAAGFGDFAIAFLVFSLSVGVVRAVVVNPLTVRHSTDEPGARPGTVGEALSAAVAAVLPVSAGLLLLAAMITGQLGATLAVLAVMLPFLVSQDTCRYAFFAWARPDLATLNDVIWAGVQFSLMAAVIAAGLAGPALMVGAWGLGAAVAAVVGVRHLGGRFAPGSALRWFRRHWGISRFWLAEYAAGQGAAQGGLLVVGGRLGSDALGAVRAAQTLTGPLAILSMAATTFGLPEVSKRPALPRRTLRLAALISGGMFAIGLVYATLLLLLPDSLGGQLFGETWGNARSVLPAVAAASVVAGLKLGPSLFIVGRGYANRSFPLVLTLSVLMIAFMITGASMNGVVGMAWGIALAEACVVPLWFAQLSRVVAAERRGGTATAQK